MPTLVKVLIAIGALLLIAVAGIVIVGKVSTSKLQNLEAERTCVELRIAITNFQVEYRQLPQVPGAEGKDLQVLTTGDTGLISILSGENPHKIVYIAPNGVNGALLDPWSNPYHVALDYDADGSVQGPTSENPTEHQAVSRSALVWSSGPDGEPGTRDDIVAD